MKRVRKPMPRREVAIESVKPTRNRIFFWATEDAALDIAQFGSLSREVGTNRYQLYVDVRYGIDEVADFIAAYDNQYRDLPEW